MANDLTNTTQPEAIMLARALEGEGIPWTCHEAASELRRLHAKVERLTEALQQIRALDYRNAATNGAAG